jgi:hypothetical protein
MPFRSPEKIPIPAVERGPEKVENYLERISQELREAGFPVTKDCRIDMEAETFQKIYPQQEIEKDKRAIEELERKWEEEGQEKSGKNYGERLEKLAIAIFHKFLGDRFFVCHSSRYDDEKHTYTKYGVDTILFHKETGNPVCAFDEVADMEGRQYQRKKEEVLEMNLAGGGRLKYGLEVMSEKGKPTIRPAKLKEIPVFYLALSSEALKRGEEEFIPSSEESSEYERKLFAYFIKSIRQQIYGSEAEKGLKARELRLPPDLRKRLNLFEGELKKIET